MIEPTADRRAPISPQLALRVATLGTVALVLFGIIFFRLWFLQVLSGDQFLAEATQNRVRSQPVQAPRGEIVDRDGNVLVRNRKALVLQLDPREIPEEERVLAAEFGDARAARSRKRPGFRGPRVPVPPPPAELRARFERIRPLTDLSVDELQRRVLTKLYQEPFVPVLLKKDIKPAVQQYIVERSEQFRGVEAKTLYLREYPNGKAGAQLFGTVNQITEEQLGTERYLGVRQGAIVGQSGLERTYDRYLRGKDGTERIYVDAANRPIGRRTARAGRPGRQLRTSIDLKLQKVGQAALARAARGKPGAFLAMDPYTGKVFAMGSAPSFDPNELSRPLTTKRFDALYGDDSGAPLTNRAVSSLYSTGSTFKPVTALAALDEGVTTTSRSILDEGVITLFPDDAGNPTRQNAKKTAFGPVDLRKAMAVSSDIYFYVVGKETFSAGKGRALQRWARRLGFGRLTGIDTGSETKGVVPDEKWRDDLNDAEARCRKGVKTPSDKPKAKGAPCGIADGSNRGYSAGDDVNLAIGQGDLQATPMQVGLSYAALATGGRIPTPRLGMSIEEGGTGRLVQELPAAPGRTVKLPPAGLATIREGLRAAASEDGGTSTDVFADWDHGRWPIHGKTGTAQTSKGDQSWYAAYVPRSATNPKPLLVVATVERGGFGAEAAAPLARQLFSQWYTEKPGPFNAGTNASL